MPDPTWKNPNSPGSTRATSITQKIAFIREGHLKQYAKKKEAPQEIKTIAEEKSSSMDVVVLQVAMSVARPE